jgi:hypothetical protein
VNVNPFRHPSALEERPDEPLRAWSDWDTHPDDLRFYTLVDDLRTVFGNFRERFKDLAWLDRRGFLVLATGQESNGKTTLLGNCAAYLQKRGVPRSADVAVTNLTDDMWVDSSVKVADISGLSLQWNSTHGADMDMYFFKEVLSYLRNRGMLFPDRCHSAAGPDAGYGALREELGDGSMYLVVLLPPLDTVEQVRTYLHLAGNRIVFLAESSPLLLATLERQTIRMRQDFGTYLYRALRNPPDRFFYHMHIGPLRDGDYWRYAARQLRRVEPPVLIKEEVVREVREHRPDSLSIGQWRGVLRQIFDKRPGLQEVLYQHFADELDFMNPAAWRELEDPEGHV